MKLGYEFVDFRSQTEKPIKIVLVGLLLAFGAGFFNAVCELINIFGNAQGQEEFSFVANGRAIDADAYAEGAILVPVGLELRLIKDLFECSTSQFVSLTWLRFEMSPPFRFPVLLLGRLELPTFFSVANELDRKSVV